MARHVNTLAWLCAGFLSGAAWAQLADPTRPALDIAAPFGAAADAGAAAAGLQSIIRRKGGKPAALINGTVVELGGRLGTARLVKIGEDFVVLRGPFGDETLRLTPAIEKKTAAAGSATTKGKQRK